MEGIEHRIVHVNNINMHVAEKGEGPVVLFLHGFPDLWYSWRHQIVAFSALGYRAVAPDLRGYGDTHAPTSVSSYNILHLTGDIVALIDSLGVDQVFLVGHDWGSIIGWNLCLFRPDRIIAYVSLSVPYMPRNPLMKPLDSMRAIYGDDYFICRFQEAGKAESEFAKNSTRQVLKNILTGRSSSAPILVDGHGLGFHPDATRPLPNWLTQQDLNYYASKFEKTGFTGAINYYRNIDLNWELTAAWTGVQAKVPAKFITGEFDVVYTSLGMKDYIESGTFKNDVPYLEEVVVQKDVGHFNNQEAAQDVSDHIFDFIQKF